MKKSNYINNRLKYEWIKKSNQKADIVRLDKETKKTQSHAVFRRHIFNSQIQRH